MTRGCEPTSRPAAALVGHGDSVSPERAAGRRWGAGAFSALQWPGMTRTRHQSKASPHVHGLTRNELSPVTGRNGDKWGRKNPMKSTCPRCPRCPRSKTRKAKTRARPMRCPRCPAAGVWGWWPRLGMARDGGGTPHQGTSRALRDTGRNERENAPVCVARKR